ncbi:MAG: cytochrome c [Hyphomicrobiales bacterium]|nr:cytochrome c [Hyphomicrobiales bacterium]
MSRMHSGKGGASTLRVARKFTAVLAFLLAAGSILHGTGSLRADETEIVLKEWSGRDAVINNCGACHSLDYIKMNSPFLDKTGWEGEVTKMIKGYGAPIDDANAKQIAAYLAANYGK